MICEWFSDSPRLLIWRGLTWIVPCPQSKPTGWPLWWLSYTIQTLPSMLKVGCCLCCVSFLAVTICRLLVEGLVFPIREFGNIVYPWLAPWDCLDHSSKKPHLLKARGPYPNPLSYNSSGLMLEMAVLEYISTENSKELCKAGCRKPVSHKYFFCIWIVQKHILGWLIYNMENYEARTACENSNGKKASPSLVKIFHSYILFHFLKQQHNRSL